MRKTITISILAILFSILSQWSIASEINFKTSIKKAVLEYFKNE